MSERASKIGEVALFTGYQETLDMDLRHWILHKLGPDCSPNKRVECGEERRNVVFFCTTTTTTIIPRPRGWPPYISKEKVNGGGYRTEITKAKCTFIIPLLANQVGDNFLKAGVVKICMYIDLNGSFLQNYFIFYT
ncbi:hypothetical protein AA313_de0200662 [Arthrobotrys entomopaga]|nr:hypothetical protein AA313_de0200662 [Arthrobotrys entomopaga]